MAWTDLGAWTSRATITKTRLDQITDNFTLLKLHGHTGADGDGAGTLTVDDGSDSAPSYSNEGDTNTGMYFPAADSVGFSLGGTDRLQLDTTTRGNAWGTWTPTWSGGVSAIGNAVVTARYWKVGRLVRFQLRATFGTTTTFAAGTITFTLPVTSSAGQVGPLGTAVLIDTGTTLNTGVVVIASTTTAICRVTVAGAAAVTNLVPHTWANTDIFDVQGSFEAAA